MLGAAFFVAVAAWALWQISPWAHGIHWWGDWLWVWPLLLLASWQLAYLKPPWLPAQHLVLCETGELADYRIQRALVTPVWLALRLTRCQSAPDAFDNLRLPATLKNADQVWVWLFVSQVSAADWVRFQRISRYCQRLGLSARR
ncbi:MAG: hypothetical protein C0463_04465 [Idiomarina sp.]|nr:hypothetical protein [Idiomarina sp.]